MAFDKGLLFRLKTHLPDQLYLINLKIKLHLINLYLILNNHLINEQIRNMTRYSEY